MIRSTESSGGATVTTSDGDTSRMPSPTTTPSGLPGEPPDALDGTTARTTWRPGNGVPHGDRIEGPGSDDADATDDRTVRDVPAPSVGNGTGDATVHSAGVVAGTGGADDAEADLASETGSPDTDVGSSNLAARSPNLAARSPVPGGGTDEPDVAGTDEGSLAAPPPGPAAPQGVDPSRDPGGDGEPSDPVERTRPGDADVTATSSTDVSSHAGTPSPDPVAAPARVLRHHASPLPSVSNARVRISFLALLVATLAATIDLPTVMAALPTIVGDLNAEAELSWIVTAPLLGTILAMPIFGKLGDLVGRKWPFVAAAAVFAIGGALAAIWAESGPDFLVFRAIQAVGAGGLIALAPAIMADLVPVRRRSRFLSLLGAAWVVGFPLGPLLAGYLLERQDWRWCFYVTCGMATVALLLGLVALTLPKRPRRRGLDMLGTLLFASATACVVLITVWGGTTHPWDSTVILGLAGGTVALVAMFLIIEKYAVEPLVPLTLFRGRGVTMAGLLALIGGLTVAGTLAFLPVVLQVVRAVTLWESGVLMAPFAAGVVVAALIVGPVIARTGRYALWGSLGVVVAAAGLGLLSFLGATSPSWRDSTAMAIFGVGAGVVVPVLLLTAQSAAPTRHVGAATAAISYAWQLGACIGTAALGALITYRLGDHPVAVEGGLTPPDGLARPTGLAPQTLAFLPPHLRPELATDLVEAVSPALLYGAPALGCAVVFSALLRDMSPKPVDPSWSGDPLKLEPLSSTDEESASAPTVVFWSADPEFPGDADVPDRPPSHRVAIPGEVAHDPGEKVGGAHGEPAYRGTTHGAETYEATETDGAEAPPAQVPDFDETELDDSALADAEPPADDLVEPEIDPQFEGHLGAYPPYPAPDGEDLESTGFEGADDFDSADVRIDVHVRQTDGRPIAGVVLTLCDLAGNEVARSTAAGDGRYELAAPEPGSYLLIASTEDYQPHAQVVDVYDRLAYVNITLRAACGIHGDVRNAVGDPVAGAVVTLTNAHGDVVTSATTGVHGSYTLNDLMPGSYTLTINAPGYRPTAHIVHVPDATRVRHDVELVGGGQLHGTVRNMKGQPLADAKITLLDSRGRVVRVTASGPSGHYRFDDIAEGSYTLVASMYPPTASGVYVVSGRNHQHDVELSYPDV